MQCAKCIYDVGVGLASVGPLFASLSTILFPNIPMCALTFWIVVLWCDHWIWLTIAKFVRVTLL